MREIGIDAMKYRKSTHLAGIDVETIIAEKGNCILTIKECYYDTNVDVSGNKTAGYFLEFHENVKPMVANSINRKVIGNIVKALKNCTSAESRNIGNWADVKIELLFDANVKMMGKVTGGIRIAEKYTLPTLTHPSTEFDNCYKAIHVSGYTMDKIRLKYIVSIEIEKLLTTKKD